MGLFSGFARRVSRQKCSKVMKMMQTRWESYRGFNTNSPVSPSHYGVVNKFHVDLFRGKRHDVGVAYDVNNIWMPSNFSGSQIFQAITQSLKNIQAWDTRDQDFNVVSSVVSGKLEDVRPKIISGFSDQIVAVGRDRADEVLELHIQEFLQKYRKTGIVFILSGDSRFARLADKCLAAGVPVAAALPCYDQNVELLWKKSSVRFTWQDMLLSMTDPLVPPPVTTQMDGTVINLGLLLEKILQDEGKVLLHRIPEFIKGKLRIQGSKEAGGTFRYIALFVKAHMHDCASIQQCDVTGTWYQSTKMCT